MEAIGVTERRRKAGPTRDQDLYRTYFERFNRGAYFEAHDVLEVLWLRERHGPLGDFYKGLIQTAGACVHLQKGRLRPAVALFRLADGHLSRYPGMVEGLDVTAVRQWLRQWQRNIEESAFAFNPLFSWPAPQLEPEDPAGES